MNWLLGFANNYQPRLQRDPISRRRAVEADEPLRGLGIAGGITCQDDFARRKRTLEKRSMQKPRSQPRIVSTLRWRSGERLDNRSTTQNQCPAFQGLVRTELSS
jgi:hypothetical protein